MLAKKEEFNYRLIWNTRKELVLAVLCFVLAFVILFMLVLKQIEPVQDVFAELEKTNRELDKFQTKVDELTNLSTDVEFNKMTEIDSVLPSYKPLLELLNNLNSVALQSNTLIKNFSLSPGEIATDSTLVARTRRKQFYDELVLEFSVSGTLADVQNFINLIELVTPISTITNISLNQQMNADSLIETTANLTLKTFYFTQPITVTLTEALPPIEDEDLIVLESIKKLIPNNLPTQEEIIKNDRGNLFNLQGMSIEELENQLIVTDTDSDQVEWQTVDETGQIIDENEQIIDENGQVINQLEPVLDEQVPIIEQ